LLNILVALCALTLTAGVLFAFVHPSGAAGGSGLHVRVAAPPRSSAPTTPAPATTWATPPQTTALTTALTTVAPTTAATVATTTTAAPPPPLDPAHGWAVGTQSFTFVDTTRSTPPAGGDPGEAFRTLPTVIRYPVDGAPGAGETAGAAGSHLGPPFPLIVFAAGYDSSPSVYAALMHAWASAGYVVAAPAFPRATAGGPLDETDVNNQPRDLSFVITTVVALAGAGGPLAGLIDTTHVGVAGHSDGASTTAGIGYNSCCHDGRVLADAVMEGDLHAYPGGSYFPPGAEPALLLIQGDHDALNPPPLGQAVYNGARSPKYLLWLINAQHLEPYTSDAAHLAVVVAVTTAFFDRYLKGRAAAVTLMRQGATPGLATLAAG
jgi:hypothetical protein